MTAERDAALGYADIGLRVVPIRPGKKFPTLMSWQEAATDDPKQIIGWYDVWPDAGVGVATGPQPCGDNIFVIDIDGEEGVEQWIELHRMYGDQPAKTWTSITGSNGLHVFYRAPAGAKIVNQQAAGRRLASSIDVRGVGGQVVVPPTIHPSGRRYEWYLAPSDCVIADAPGWLLHLVTERDVPDVPERPSLTVVSDVDDDELVFSQFRRNWDWEHELLKAGWSFVSRKGDDSLWARPGKHPRDGHSAVLHEPDGPLVVWTTQLDPDLVGRGTRSVDGSAVSFSAFEWFAATQHGGDRSEAYRTLQELFDPAPELRSLIADREPYLGPDFSERVNLDDPDDVLDAQLRRMLIDWAEFAETDFESQEWLWPEVIPAGRSCAIWAKGGTGKSLVMLRMAVDMIEAGHNVLILDYEMSPTDLNDRLIDMDVDPLDLVGSGLHYAQVPPLDPMDTERGGQQVRRLAAAVNADVVIIDTFARAVSGDEDSADTVRAFYRATGMLLKQDGRAWVRLDHAGKGNADDARGSSAKNDDVDLVWKLSKTDSGYEFKRGKVRMGYVQEKVQLVRSDEPFVLRLQRSSAPSYPEGTGALHGELRGAGIDFGLSERRFFAAARDAGVNASNKRLRAAKRYHVESSSVSFLVDDPERGTA